MTTERRITLGLQLFFLIIAVMLIFQGEIMMAVLPLLLGIGGITWQVTHRQPENDHEKTS